MASAEIPTAVLVFFTSLLAAPLIYTLDKLAIMEDPFYVFFAGCIVLLVVAFMSQQVVKRGSGAGQHELLFYVWSVFAFTGIVDLFIALELDGYVKGFMEFYLREGEPYLRSAYGTMINWWDGIGHFSMYIGMIALLCSGRSYRQLGLYWVGSICHSMIVFLPGNMTGNKGIRWSYLLNVPYVVYPFYAGVRFLREGMRLKRKQPSRDKESKIQVIEGLMAAWFVLATVVAVLRFIAVMGCKEQITKDYITLIEPYLMDPGQYGKIQAAVYFFYFLPFYVASGCCWWYGEQIWMRDWSIIHAGASAQAQLVFITCSLKWRTPEAHRVPDEFYARLIFWVVNLSLLVVPHMYAVFCNRAEVMKFVSGVTTSSVKESTPDDTTPSVPVTRQRKRIQ